MEQPPTLAGNACKKLHSRMHTNLSINKLRHKTENSSICHLPNLDWIYV